MDHSDEGIITIENLVFIDTNISEQFPEEERQKLYEWADEDLDKEKVARMYFNYRLTLSNLMSIRSCEIAEIREFDPDYILLTHTYIQHLNNNVQDPELMLEGLQRYTMSHEPQYKIFHSTFVAYVAHYNNMKYKQFANIVSELDIVVSAIDF